MTFEDPFQPNPFYVSLWFSDSLWCFMILKIIASSKRLFEFIWNITSHYVFFPGIKWHCPLYVKGASVIYATWRLVVNADARHDNSYDSLRPLLLHKVFLEREWKRRIENISGKKKNLASFHTWRKVFICMFFVVTLKTNPCWQRWKLWPSEVSRLLVKVYWKIGSSDKEFEKFIVCR